MQSARVLRGGELRAILNWLKADDPHAAFVSNGKPKGIRGKFVKSPLDLTARVRDPKAFYQVIALQLNRQHRREAGYLGSVCIPGQSFQSGP